MVAPWAARLASFSRSGTGVRPSMRVMMTVWLTVGKVYSEFSAAAAPQKLETPGYHLTNAVCIQCIHLLPDGTVQAGVASV